MWYQWDWQPMTRLTRQEIWSIWLDKHLKEAYMKSNVIGTLRDAHQLSLNHKEGICFYYWCTPNGDQQNRKNWIFNLVGLTPVKWTVSQNQVDPILLLWTENAGDEWHTTFSCALWKANAIIAHQTDDESMHYIMACWI